MCHLVVVATTCDDLPRIERPPEDSPAARASYLLAVYRAFGSTLIVSGRIPEEYASASKASVLPADPNLSSWSELVEAPGRLTKIYWWEEGRGWPLLSFSCRATRWGPLKGGVVLNKNGRTLARARCQLIWNDSKYPSLHDVVLPLRPLWAGLLLNTVLYGMAWIGLLYTVATTAQLALASVRHYRGLCPACAYRLYGGSDFGCPECGWRRTNQSS